MLRNASARPNCDFDSLSSKEKEQYQAEIKEKEHLYLLELQRWFEVKGNVLFLGVLTLCFLFKCKFLIF